MGWILNVLDKLGLTEREKRSGAVEVHINDLQDWIKIRTEDIVYQFQLEEAQINYVNSLKDKRWALECKLDEWDQKIVQLGLGSTNTEDISRLFRNTRRFLELLTFPDKVLIKDLLELNSRLDLALEELQKALEASTFSYNYSFILSKDEKETDLNPLLKEIVDTRRLKDEFEDRIISSGYSKMENIRRKAFRLDELREKIKVLTESLTMKKEKLKMVEDRKMEKERELVLLEDNSDFSRLRNVAGKKQIYFKQMEELTSQINSWLAKVKPALKQYQEIYPGNKLVKDYLERPTDTFYTDEGLAILSLVKSLKQSLDENKILLNAASVESFLSAFHQQEELSKLHREYLQLKAEIRKSDIPHTVTRDLSFKLEEAKYRLDHFSNQFDKMEEEVNSVEEELRKTDVALKGELDLFQNLVKIALGKEMTVKV